MVNSFHGKIDKLKQKLITLGGIVEKQLVNVRTAILNNDMDIAQTVLEGDEEIDDLEVEIEEECLNLLACNQPFAKDFRFIIAVIKINNDIERIGDEATNIARRLQVLHKHTGPRFDCIPMLDKTIQMLKMSLDAIINLDSNLAKDVCVMDSEVNQAQRAAYDWMKTQIKDGAGEPGYLLNLFLIPRHIERIADHTTNIAEEVIYSSRGNIIRHGKH